MARGGIWKGGWGLEVVKGSPIGSFCGAGKMRDTGDCRSQDGGGGDGLTCPILLGAGTAAANWIGRWRREARGRGLLELASEIEEGPRPVLNRSSFCVCAAKRV